MLHATGVVNFYGTGMSGPAQFSLFDPITLADSQAFSITVDASPWQDGSTIVTIQAEAQVKAQNGKIGLRLEAGSDAFFTDSNAIAGWPSLTGQASVQWNDRVTLFANGAARPLPFSDLLFNYNVAASLETSLGNFPAGFTAQMENRAQITAEVTSLRSWGSTWTISQNALWNPFDQDLDITLAPGLIGTVALDPNRSAPFTHSLSGAVFVNFGFSRADAFHTMELASVTFPDGTTPESHGWDVVFESGMRSPNLPAAAVPEPSSITLISIGGIAAFGVARRRKSSLP